MKFYWKISVVILAVFLVVALPLNSLASPSLSPPVKKASPDPGHIKGPGGIPARGGESEIWVYPRNKSPQDAVNIQWAVNQIASGGSIYLMATDPDEHESKPFFFGYGPNSDRVVLGALGNHVAVVGQTQLELDPYTGRPTGNINGTPTVIRGGHNTFVSGATGEDVYGIPGTNVFGDRMPKINLAIRGIVFEGCFEMCIWVAGSTSFEVSGNKFVKPRLLGVDAPHPLGHAVFFGIGPEPETIESTRVEAFGLPPAGVTDHDVSGQVVIQGNYVQGEAFSSTRVEDFDADDYPILYDGIYYSGASNGLGYNEGVDALVIIANNTIDSFLSSGVFATSNKGSGDNTTIVRNNLIIQGHHGWWGGALYAVNLKSADMSENTIKHTNGVLWVEETSGLVYRANTVSGDGQWGIDVNSNSTNNVIDVLPGELDGFVPAEFHIKLDSTSTGNMVMLNGSTGLTVIDEDAKYNHSMTQPSLSAVHGAHSGSRVRNVVIVQYCCAGFRQGTS